MKRTSEPPCLEGLPTALQLCHDKYSCTSRVNLAWLLGHGCTVGLGELEVISVLQYIETELSGAELTIKEFENRFQ